MIRAFSVASIIICVFVAAYATPVEDIIEETEGVQYDLAVRKRDDGYTLKVFDKKGTLLMQYETKSIFEPLVDSDEVTLRDYPHNLLVTQWSFGAHSQKIVIFDPNLKEKSELYSAVSSYQAKYEVKGDHLHIELPMMNVSEGDKTPEIEAPEIEAVDWKPTAPPKDSRSAH